jgi:hypothetical protein
MHRQVSPNVELHLKTGEVMYLRAESMDEQNDALTALTSDGRLFGCPVSNISFFMESTLSC